jgi:hypothetical protein
VKGIAESISSDKSSRSSDVEPLWTCYICNHTEFKKRKGMVRDDSSMQIFECVSCGLVALSSVKHIQADHYEDGQVNVEFIFINKSGPTIIIMIVVCWGIFIGLLTQLFLRARYDLQK